MRKKIKRKPKGNRKRKIRLGAVAVTAVFIMAATYLASHYNLLPQRVYAARAFQIETIYSKVDFNKNGVDDYTDLMLGARLDAKEHPTYNGAYYDGGYPPQDIGVCTDVIWRAFKNAGYSLRAMVDQDIRRRPNQYLKIKQRDPNIDFRRVSNLHVFFEEYAVSLTLDPDQIEKWQPGDIVIFDQDEHIGMISDKRNNKGQPYIIHNGGQPNREEDYLKRNKITGHYRFDALNLSEEILVKWE